VPNPSVTPTNLLYNVVAGPGALLRYRRDGALGGPLVRRLVLGTLPGVVLGAIIRVFVLPGPNVFRLLVAALMLPLGVWLIVRTLRTESSKSRRPELSPRSVTGLALAVGIVGGIYGIGGGSILGPILVGTGMVVATVAPAALISTWVTSLVGVGTYAVISLNATGPISPDWSLGIATGLGGLTGGWLGASVQPRIPERALRMLLGVMALALALMYLVQVVR